MSEQYRSNIVCAYPSIKEIWLIGSRANGTEHPNSDWDYIVWCDNDSILNSLCQDVRFNATGIDLFIVVEGQLIKPWRETDGSYKRLSLCDDGHGLAWKKLSESSAEYIETKELGSGSIDVVRKVMKARRVYLRE